MTTWSAADPATGHLKVGINVSTSDSTPSYGESITITIDYYIETVNWTYGDTMTLHWQAFGTSGSVSVNIDLSSNQAKKYLTKTHTYTAGSSSIAVTAGASVTGAYDGADPSLSNTTRYTIPATGGVPDPPITPGYGTATPTSQVITWAAPGTNGSAITGYRLAYRTNPSGAWNYITLGNVLTRTVTGLSPGTAYDYKVQANSSAGYGSYSTIRTVSTTVTAPGNPSPSSSDGSVVSGGALVSGVAVSWTPGATNGATGVGYDVYVSTSSTAPTGATTPSGSTSGNSLTITSGILPSTAYYAWVRVTWATPAGSPGAWQASNSNPITTQASGAAGDLVDRANAAFTQIGEDNSSPTCVVYATATQSIAQSPSSTILSWGAATINTGGGSGVPMWVSGPNVVANEPGIYDLSGQLTFGASSLWTGAEYGEAKIEVNGTAVAFNAVSPPGPVGGSTPVPVKSTLVTLAQGDIVTLVGIQSLTSGAFNDLTGPIYTSLSVRRVGP